MTANNTNKKAPSARRKLIPATAMLLASALALSSSTYAWFTMSREVEVQNIQMTATVPEDMQISLGKIYDASAATSTETYSLAKSTGWLKLSGGEAEAPREATATTGEGANAVTSPVANDELDWSNTADISKYYEFGKLIPASSTDGLNVYYTPDASGVGRTIKTQAVFYQAAAGKQANKTGAATAVEEGEDSAKATAHILTKEEIRVASGTDALWSAAASGYSVSTDWNDTNDDGYYIDIPVWLRTSSTEQPSVYVSGYVTSKSETTADSDVDDLYKAVRVAILDPTTTSGTETYAADKGCLTLNDGLAAYIDPSTGSTTHTGKFPAYSNSGNILDSDNYNGTGVVDTNLSKTLATGRIQADSKIYGVSGLTTTVSETTTPGAWSVITQNNASSDCAVATLPVGTGTEYGASKKLIIRVWLEGEDGNCWNENAGQDWNIALKFSKTPLTNS